MVNINDTFGRSVAEAVGIDSHLDAMPSLMEGIMVFNKTDYSLCVVWPMARIQTLLLRTGLGSGVLILIG